CPTGVGETVEKSTGILHRHRPHARRRDGAENRSGHATRVRPAMWPGESAEPPLSGQSGDFVEWRVIAAASGVSRAITRH
ncbi:MAG: hypothetical protein RL347_1390, partial [Actinomycetota bacterium]